MAYLKPLIACLALLPFGAHAFYTSMTPPPGWSPGMSAAWGPMVSGQLGTYNAAAAQAIANAQASSKFTARFKGGTYLLEAGLNLGGKTISPPITMRAAANAARVAAIQSYGSPLKFAVGLGIGIAGPLAIKWFFDQGFQVVDGQWVKRNNETAQPCTGTCIEYSIAPDPYWHPTKSAACASFAAIKTATASAGVTYTVSTTANNEGQYCLLDRTYNGAIARNFTSGFYGSRTVNVPENPPQYVPVTQQEFEDKMAPQPIPDDMPLQIPWVDFPTEEPVFNPAPSPLPQPAPNPKQTPRPLFVPTGLPVPVPGSDPAQWTQPGTKINPAPTPADPWQVDVAPDSIPQSSPDPKTPEELNPPSGAPVPTGQPIGLCDQYPDIAACAPAADPQEQIDYCKEHPEILACQKLDEPEDVDLPTDSVDVSITPDSGWGSGSGSCPADRKMSHATFSFKPYCDFAAGLRPVIVAVAWLVGAGILVGVGSKGD